MLFYELRKITFNKGFIILLIFALLIKLFVGYISFINADEQFNKFYDEYTKLYFGKTPEQKIEMIDMEQKRLEKILFSSSQTTENSSDDTKSQSHLYIECLYRQEPFRKVAFKVSNIEKEHILKESTLLVENSKLEDPLHDWVGDPKLFGKIPIPEVVPDRGWDFFIVITEWDFIPIIILVGLARVFSNEYESGMHNLLLSTVKGQKVLFRKKIMASIIFTFIVVTFFVLLDLFLGAVIGPMGGWTATIRSLDIFYHCLTHITIWQYIVIYYFMKLFIGLCTACIVLYISSITRKSYTTLVAGICIFGISAIVTSLFKNGTDLMLFGIVNVHRLFSHMSRIRIGKISIGVIYLLFVLHGILMMVLIMGSYKNYLVYKHGGI